MNTHTSQTENSLPYCEKLPETACATSLSNVTVSRVSFRAAKCHSLRHLHTIGYTSYFIGRICQHKVQYSDEISNRQSSGSFQRYIVGIVQTI